MKKLFCSALVLTAALSLAGCGGNKNNSPSTDANSAQPTSSQTDNQIPPATSNTQQAAQNGSAIQPVAATQPGTPVTTTTTTTQPSTPATTTTTTQTSTQADSVMQPTTVDQTSAQPATDDQTTMQPDTDDQSNAQPATDDQQMSQSDSSQN